MLGAGDELSIQLALLAAGLTFGGVAVTQAGWTHKIFIWASFALAAIFLVLGCLWKSIAAYFTSLSQFSVGPVFWFALVTGLVPYLCFHVSQKVTRIQNTQTHTKSYTKEEVNGNAPCKTIAIPMVEEDFVYGAVHRTFPPRYAAKFSKNGLNASFYIEYSCLPYNVMGPIDWSQRRKLRIYSEDRFATGENVSFPLAYKTETSGRVIWRLGSEAGRNEPILDTAFYRGRVTAVDDEGNEQHTYFFLKHEHTKNEDPEFIGAHMFDAASIWT